jgi:hypothetical protein
LISSAFEREGDSRAAYRNTVLGIEMQIPPRLERVKPTPGAMLSVRGAPGVRGAGVMGLAGQVLDDKLVAALRGSRLAASRGAESGS